MDDKNMIPHEPEQEPERDLLAELAGDPDVTPDQLAQALGEVEPNPVVLTDPVLAEEITPDEDAMASVGLTHPDEPQSPVYEEFRDEAYREAFGEGDALSQVFRGEDAVAEQPQEEILPEEPQPEPEPEPEPREEIQIRKRRPKRKKGEGLLGIPHMIATVVWLAIILAIGVSLGRLVWVCAADVLAFGREEKLVTISVEDSDTLDTIALKLQEAGLIRYPELFKLYAGLTDAREDISSGTFTLNTLYDYHALVGSMTTYSSFREEVTVMIPEGYSCAQIFALLEEKGVCSAMELEMYAAEGELDDYWFLENVERGDKYCLEGFLFPDTYDFYVNDDAERVLEKMLDDFDYRFSEEMEAGIETLNEKLAGMMRANGYGDDYIAEHRMDVRQVVIVASLIEKEPANNDESFTIYSVIYNRLTNQAAYPFLNIDAALLYALGHKEALTLEDLQTDNPYNTYTRPGLIPGPIANPGLNSLSAALNPEDTKFHYYALDPSAGVHKFSKTLEEHNSFLNSLGG